MNFLHGILYFFLLFKTIVNWLSFIEFKHLLNRISRQLSTTTTTTTSFSSSSSSSSSTSSSSSSSSPSSSSSSSSSSSLNGGGSRTLQRNGNHRDDNHIKDEQTQTQQLGRLLESLERGIPNMQKRGANFLPRFYSITYD